MGEQIYEWRWRKFPVDGDRYKKLCRVLARGRMNSCLVQFLEDGKKYIVSRNGLAKACECDRIQIAETRTD